MASIGHILADIGQALSDIRDTAGAGLDWISNLAVWHQFQFIPTTGIPTGRIFGVGEFLSTLALLIAVLANWVFRYRCRLSVALPDLRRIGFWLALAVGLLLLGTDLIFDNQL